MATKKTGSSRATGGDSVRKKKTAKVVDPMIVSNKKAKAHEDMLVEESALNYDEFDLLGGDSYNFDRSHDDLFEGDYDSYDDVLDQIGYDKDIEEIAEVDTPKKKTTKKTTKASETASKRENRGKVGEARKRKVGQSEDDFNEQQEKETAKQNKKQLKQQKKADKKRRKKEKNRTPIWAKILIGFLVCVIIAIIGGGVYIYNILSKTSETFEGNPLDFLIGTDLKEDENGWSHVLVFGTSEDQEENGHGGAELSDSIIVLSTNQKKKVAKMFSIPRDLYVNYSTSDEALGCWVGYRGKINATYMCSKEDNDGDKKKASTYFAKKVSEITGLDIQYYAAVDWSVLIGVVDALGGVDVEPYTDDERGLMDICQNIDWPKGVRHINGDEAIRLARARGACYPGQGIPTENYGLSRSNFDREINQQRIINAIKEKAMSIGILADPNKVFGILDSFGENITTNITLAEMRTVLDIVMAMKGEVSHIDTVDYFGTDRIGEQSVVVPRGTSMYDYSRIQRMLSGEFARIPDEVETDETSEE